MNKMMVSVIVLFYFTIPVFAADIYVATTGNDTTGNGTLGNPYLTVYKGLLTIQSGDTLIIRAGTYTATTVDFQVRKSNVRIKSYPGERAHLTAPVNYDPVTHTPIAPYATLSVRGYDNVTVQDLELSGSSQYPISFASVNKIPSRYGTLQNSHIHNCGLDCVKVQPGSDNFTIEGCEIDHTIEGAYSAPTLEEMRLRSQNGQGLDIVQCDNVVIRNNYFHDIRGRNDAVVPKGGSRNVLIEKNLVDTSWGGFIAGGQTGPEYMDYVDNPDGYQIINCTIRNNIIKNTKWEGILLVEADGCQIYNNTLLNVGALAGTDELYTTNPGTFQKEAYQGTGLFIRHMANYTGDMIAKMPASRNILWKNNLIIRDSGPYATNGVDSGPGYQCVTQNAGLSDKYGVYHLPIEPGNLLADYNYYYDPNFPEMRFRSAMTLGGVLSIGFNNWRASSPLHSTLNDQHSAYTNPQINLTTGAPLVDSPLRGSGTPISGLTEDFYGNTRSGTIDIGAIQVSGSVTTAPSQVQDFKQD
jgi:parallel beta-helix repeat protein